MGEHVSYQTILTVEDLEQVVEDMRRVAREHPHDVAKEIMVNPVCGRGLLIEDHEIDTVLSYQDLGEVGNGWLFSAVLSKKHDYGKVPSKLLDMMHRVVFNNKMNVPVGPVLQLPQNPILPNQRQFVMVEKT